MGELYVLFVCVTSPDFQLPTLESPTPIHVNLSKQGVECRYKSKTFGLWVYNKNDVMVFVARVLPQIYTELPIQIDARFCRSRGTLLCVKN